MWHGPSDLRRVKPLLAGRDVSRTDVEQAGFCG